MSHAITSTTFPRSNGKAKVAVFVDGANQTISARQMQPFGDTTRRDINMAKSGDILAGKRLHPSEMVAMHVFYGVMDASIDERRHARQMDDVCRWERDLRVKVHTRPLRWNASTGKYQEKGIDMQLGLAFTDAQKSGEVDVVILWSGDSDLAPAVEKALDNRSGARVELARWSSQRGGPWVPGRSLWCHYLDVADFRRCSTPRNYRDAA